MHQGFVIAVLVTRRELQVTVDVKTQIVLPTRDDQTLIWRSQCVHDLVPKHATLAPIHEAVRSDETGSQQRKCNPRTQNAPLRMLDLRSEAMNGPQGDG